MPQGPKPYTILSAVYDDSPDESAFRSWYSGISKALHLNPDPDDPRHYYDWRAAYAAGEREPDEHGHWPSEYKLEGHPNMFVGGVNTKTGEPVPPSKPLAIDAFIPDEEPYAIPKPPTLQVPQNLPPPPAPQKSIFQRAADALTSRSPTEVVNDLGVTLGKGVIGLGETAVGAVDFLGKVDPLSYVNPLSYLPAFKKHTLGKLLADVGYDPAKAHEVIAEDYSAPQKAAEQEVAKQTTFLGTLKASAQNPSVPFHSVIESLIPMVAGGVMGGELPVAAELGGAIGEGLSQSFQQLEQFRQASPDGTVTPKQFALAATTGAIDTMIGKYGGQLAKRFGFADPDTLVASSLKDPALRKSLADIAKELPMAALSEATEETAQSYQEKVGENLGTPGKKWNEGAAQAAASGGLSGLLMGFGAEGSQALSERAHRPPVDPAATGIPGVSPEVVDTARRVEQHVEQVAAGVPDADQLPLRLTIGQRLQLVQLGYPGEMINGLAPHEAAEIIDGGIPGPMAPAPMPPEAPSPEPIAPVSPLEAPPIAPEAPSEPVPGVPGPVPVPPQEVISATQEGFVPEGHQPEYPGNEGVRTPAETGGGGVAPPSPGVEGGQQKPQAVRPRFKAKDGGSKVRVFADPLDAAVWNALHSAEGARSRIKAARGLPDDQFAEFVRKEIGRQSHADQRYSYETTKDGELTLHDAAGPTTHPLHVVAMRARQLLDKIRPYDAPTAEVKGQTKTPESDVVPTSAEPAAPEDLTVEEDVQADQKPEYYRDHTIKQLRAEFQAWDLSTAADAAGSANQQGRLDAMNREMERRGLAPMARYKTRVDNYMAAYRESLAQNIATPDPHAFGLDDDAGKHIRARVDKGGKPKGARAPAAEPPVRTGRPEPSTATPPAKPYAEMTRDEKIAAIKAKLETNVSPEKPAAPAPPSSRAVDRRTGRYVETTTPAPETKPPAPASKPAPGETKPTIPASTADPFADDDAAAAYRYLLDDKEGRRSEWEDKAIDSGLLRTAPGKVWGDDEEASLLEMLAKQVAAHPEFLDALPLDRLRDHLTSAEDILSLDPGVRGQDWLDDVDTAGIRQLVGTLERVILHREGQQPLDFSLRVDPPLDVPPTPKPQTKLEKEQADLDARRQAARDKREAALKKLNENLGYRANVGIDPENIGLVVDIIDSYLEEGLVTLQEMVLEFRKQYGRREDLDPYFETAWELHSGEQVKVSDIAEAPPLTSSATLYRALRTETLPTDNKAVKAFIVKTIPGADANSNEMLNAATDAIEAVLASRLSSATQIGEGIGTLYNDARTLEGQLTRAYRTPEKMRLQQFSTPLPIAVATTRAAQVRPADRILEPTAGTGNLVAPLKGAAVTLAEIDPSRAELLKAQGWQDVRTQDYLRAPIEKNAYDVIVTNPPWGKYSTGKYGEPIAGDFRPGDVAERFIAKNMRELKPGGRLVAVMPTTMLGPSGVNFRGFLDKHGVIRAIIKSPPKAYDTRGTSVESILLVVDKHGGPRGTGDRVTSLETADWAAYEAAVERIGTRGETITPEERPGTPQGTGQPARPGPRSPGGRSGGSSGSPGRPVRTKPGQRPAPVVADVQPGQQPTVEEPRGEPQRPARADTTDPLRGLSDEQVVAYRAAERSAFFSPYRLRTTLNGVRHPRIMVEARGLAGVEYPSLDYVPSQTFERIIAEGRASIEQGEQALAAVQANVQGQHGYLVADNVGVGKAREAWLTIIELMERAKLANQPLRVILTTKNADNITNLIQGELPALIGDQPPGFEIVEVANYKESRRTNSNQGQDVKSLPKPTHGVYVVDSYNLAPFREALIEANVNGFVADEAHRFKNVSGEADVGAAWQQLHADVFSRVPRDQQVFTYFTATPAQAVEDYQYLYGIRMWPIDGFGDWVDMVTGQATEEEAGQIRAAAEAGGYDVQGVAGNTSDTIVGADSEDVATTPRPRRGGGGDVFSSRLTPAEGEQITREWKRLGRFSSRDLWREGTEFEIHAADLKREHRARYDQFAELARSIVAAAAKFGRANKQARSSIGGIKSQLQFAAKRVQMQPSLEEGARLAKEYLKSGHQVVLSLINVSEFDPTAGNIAAAINQINFKHVEVDDDGTVHDLGEIPEALVARAELAEQAAAVGNLPSPVTYLEEELGAENIAFIIGRNDNRDKHAREFQDGARKVAVISAAGSTGISLDHRVQTDSGAKGRRVFIDVQFEWSATEAIQRYGRVDRASQISGPKIVPLSFGTAAEKKFLSTIANRMSSLGALSKGGSETTGADLSEFEINGGEALAAAREAWNKLPDDVKEFFLGRQFHDAIPVGGGNFISQPKKRTQASIKDITLGLLFVPTEEASAYWESFIAERDRLAALNTEGADRRTKGGKGELLRSIPLTPELTLHQVRDDNGMKFGILSGVVMPEIPRIRDFLRDSNGDVRRPYVSFTAGDQVFAGLGITWSRTNGLAKFYGRALQAEVLDTPAKVLEALKAGDVLPLDQKDAAGNPWRLRMRRDGKIAIDGVKMADRKALANYPVAFHAAGNWWEATDLAKFIERFPVAKPQVAATAEELESDEDVSESIRPTGGPPARGGTVRAGIPPRSAQPGPPTPPSIGAQRFNRFSAVEFPELLHFARQLIGERVQIVRYFRKLGVLGQVRSNTTEATIRLKAELFKPGNEVALAATIAHEIGHVVDWLPHKYLKRGNLLGRLFSLKKFLRGTFTDPTGKVIENKVIREELLAVTRGWDPYDVAKVDAGYKRYRESAGELYADALSALLTNPAFLEKTAPDFFQAFMTGLDTKPEVKAAYFELMEQLAGTREEVVQRRVARDLAMFGQGNTKAIDLQRQRIAERDSVGKDIWLKLRTEILDKHTKLYDFSRTVEKRGGLIPEEQDPRFLLEERAYLGGKISGWMKRTIQPLYGALGKAEIPWDHFGLALMYERIIAGDRSEIGNPNGNSPAVAQESYDALRRNYTTAQLDTLDTAIEDFRAAFGEVTEAAYNAGLYTDSQWSMIENNPAYATFQIIEHMDDPMTAAIIQQKGTVKGTANVADATILKAMATIRATEHNLVKVGTFQFLHKEFADQIQQAPESMAFLDGRKVRMPKDPPIAQQKKLKLVKYKENGRTRGKWVDPYIAHSLNAESLGASNSAIQVLRLMNSRVWRPLFTTYNPGFMTFNVARDFLRFWKNIPTMSVGRALALYAKAAPMASARAFGTYDPETATRVRKAGRKLLRKPIDRATGRELQAQADVIAAEEARVFSITFNDMAKGREAEDTQIEDIFVRTGIDDPKIRQNPLIKALRRGFLDPIENVGNFIETLPKAAGIIHYTGHGSIGTLTAAQRSHIRRSVGSPDFLAGGAGKSWFNEIFLFSNAIIQSTRADARVATEPATRMGYWYKTALLNLVPKAMMFAMLLGAGGADKKRLWEKISEYDFTNYLPIPIGRDAAGNTIYLRLPQDDSGRLIGGIFWKGLHLARGDRDTLDSIAQIFDYTAGQAPGLTPTLDMLASTKSFVTGHNPYDEFRGRNVFTDDEWKARYERPLKTASKFLGWEFQQSGGSVFLKFVPGETLTRAETPWQKVLEFPLGVANLAGRWVKVSSYGDVERLRQVKAGVEGKEAAARQAQREEINREITRYRSLQPWEQSEAERKRMAARIVKKVYPDEKKIDQAERAHRLERTLKVSIKRGEADPYADQLLSATSNEQKAAIIHEAKASMSPDEYRQWYQELRRDKLISDPLDKLARGK